MNPIDYPTRTVLPRRTRVLVPRQTTSGITIPSSAVVAIGLGFVAFAFTVLSLLLALRVLRVKRRVTEARRNGRPETTFRTIWEEEGGVFGFLTGQGDGMGIGAGGVADVTRIRRMLEELKKWDKIMEKIPDMYDVEVLPKGEPSKAAMDMRTLSPLAVQSSPYPPFTDRARLPQDMPSPDLYLQVLISMPAEPSDQNKRRRASTVDGEEYDELPEVAVGSTTIIPMMYDPRPEMRDPRLTSSVAKVKGVAEHLEYVNGNERDEGHTGSGRRIRWEKAELGKWKIEGLG